MLDPIGTRSGGPVGTSAAGASADDSAEYLNSEYGDDRRQIEHHPAEPHPRNDSSKRRQYRIGDHVEKSGHDRGITAGVEGKPTQQNPSENQDQVDVERETDNALHERRESVESATSVGSRHFDIGGSEHVDVGGDLVHLAPEGVTQPAREIDHPTA